MTVSIITGDCREQLRTLPAASAQCCVTSPPYFGQRDYGVDGQIGHEQSPSAYIAELVEVFREVKRVLRPDGTLWLNIGDTYASDGGSGKQGTRGQRFGRRHTQEKLSGPRRFPDEGIKPKDLMMIPAMLAIALRHDGWYLRRDVIWHKPNPTAESVTDRPTTAHEYVFLLSQSDRYFYDADAIKEKGVIPAGTRGAKGSKARAAAKGVNGRPPTYWEYTGFRNARSVWTIQTRPFHGAHYATMAPELAERCILAGSRPGDTVLDPFGGAGTTGLAADRLGRSAVLIELNPAHAQMSRRRIEDDAGMFLQVSA